MCIFVWPSLKKEISLKNFKLKQPANVFWKGVCTAQRLPYQTFWWRLAFEIDVLHACFIWRGFWFVKFSDKSFFISITTVSSSKTSPGTFLRPSLCKCSIISISCSNLWILSRINLYSIYSSREVIEVHTVALRGDVEKVVDWSPEPLRDLSEAREDTLDDEKDEEVGKVVWTSAGSLLRLGQRQHKPKICSNWIPLCNASQRSIQI